MSKKEDSLDISKQLEEMKNMKDGWAEGMQLATEWGKIPGGYGKAPSHEGLDWLKEQFKKYYPNKLPPPYLYPTPEGGVQAEWSVGRWECSLEIDLENRYGEWIAYNLKTDKSTEIASRLDFDYIWNHLTCALFKLYTTP